MISKNKIILMIMSILCLTSFGFSDNLSNISSNLSENNNNIESKIDNSSIFYLDLNNNTNLIFIVLMLCIVGFLLYNGLYAISGIIGLVIGLMLLFNGLNILISLFIVLISMIIIFK